MKTIATSPNKNQLVFGLVRLDNGNGLVYVKKTNYQQGKNVTRWVICNKPRQSHNDFQNMASNGMPFQEAYAMYVKKINNKQKY